MVYVRRTNRELARRNEIIAKEKERAEASEKAKEIFFNNISHEFRTPLTLILGPLDETLEKTSDDTIKPGLQIMQRNALRLQDMITELLDLSKLEFGKVKLLAKEENIVKLTQDYLQSFESLADQRRIKLKFKSDAKEYKAWIDSEKFEKILANLLSNAFNFSRPQGEIRITVGSKQSAVGMKSIKDRRLKNGTTFKNGVYITVSDSGIGIPKEKLPHIFDRFFQVGESSQAHHAGTGIGLALTKELVELHHGTINVISEPGKGTTFTVFIPFGHEHFSEEKIFVEQTKEKEAEKTEWAVDKEISGYVTEEEVKKKNELPILLIIEDNADMRAYIKSHLEKKYTIIEAIDGETGLQAAIDNIPDLIISDVMMPKMDGYEMTEKIKTDPRTNHIPVIILTARASVESKIEGLETGADAHVTKPFNAREIQVRVKKLIEQRQKLREYFSRTLESLDLHLVKDSRLPSMDQQFIKKAIDVVTEHIADDGFNARTFAREMALSRVQLHRKLKALTNKTTTEFIRTLRLNRAASLLKGQTGNVTEIAYEVGFSSLSYFTSSFTEQFGSTPSAFVQKNKTR
ncbi:MAG: response regulator [Bacteroidales bacterium]|nr:response regulator [Bacteroidota bacterium]MBL6949313.1 response regulator [Bacteroidales bacterium]